MAWPSEAASEPSSCLCGHPRTSNFTRHRRHRSRKRPSSSETSGPSAKLLLLLSSIVSASTATASPGPPSFLCPSIASNSVQNPCHSRRTDHPPTSSDPDDPDHNQSQSKPETTKRWVPDKYEEGEDGIWRRVESYTLYGATVPSTCDGPDCPPPRSVSSVGVPLKPILGANGTATPPPIDIQLPPGWQPASKPSHGRTTTILAISLALSLFICVLIISSLFWRKSVIDKRKKITDVEAKDQSRDRREDLTIAELRRLEHEKEAEAMQKLWARATARWRANARYTLRLRRGKRMIRSNHPHQLSISAQDSGSRLIGSQPSVLASMPSREDEYECLSSRDQHSTPAEDIQMPRRSSSPPAYQHGNGLPSIVISSPTYSTGLSTPSHRSLSRRHSQPSLCPSSTDSQQPSSEHGLFHTVAHVATDDKGLLARLADMASAPPEDNDEVSRPHVSAPEWQEELELEGFDATSPTTPNILSAPSPFPPPPSKERLAAAERLEYGFTYDDLENADPELEPSAPPFEERSSLPRDGPSPFPSAPPTFDGDEDHRPSLPSAPAWEDSFPRSFPPSLPAAGQDHERTVT